MAQHGAADGAGVWFFAMGWRVLSAPEGRGTAMPPNAVQCLIPTAALLWVLDPAVFHHPGGIGAAWLYLPGASAKARCFVWECCASCCMFPAVPGCTVQQYGSLAFYFATCHEPPQAIFELRCAAASLNKPC
ncbi:MAG: hypothetical protein ACLVHY_02655 [Gemmiger sp.]